MATLNFRVKTNKDFNSIYLRFKQGGQFDVELSTGIEAPKDRWSNPKQQILQTTEIDYKAANIKLRDLGAFIQSEFHLTKLDEVKVNSRWLKEKISMFFNRETNNADIDNKVFVSNYITNFIEEARTKKSRKNTPIKNRTIQHYTTTMNKILEYEKFIGKRLKLIDLDLKFHSKFTHFLEHQQHLNPNTIGGYVDDIKLFCSNADKRQLQVSKDYKLSEFYTPSNSTTDIYLNEDEIEKIFNTCFEQDYLDNAKDWLIIGVWTGLRVSDLLKLVKEDIRDGFIHNVNEKTDYPAIIPIHWQVQTLLDKRNGDFPRQISDQKFNLYIKEVCKRAGITEKTSGAKIIKTEVETNGKKETIHRKQRGIYPKNELVSSHTCRRSFATNLYGKIDTLTIMKVTGHKSESQFLKYIKITPIEYAEKLKSLWNKFIHGKAA